MVEEPVEAARIVAGRHLVARQHGRQVGQGLPVPERTRLRIRVDDQPPQRPRLRQGPHDSSQTPYGPPRVVVQVGEVGVQGRAPDLLVDGIHVVGGHHVAGQVVEGRRGLRLPLDVVGDELDCAARVVHTNRHVVEGQHGGAPRVGGRVSGDIAQTHESVGFVAEQAVFRVVQDVCPAAFGARLVAAVARHLVGMDEASDDRAGVILVTGPPALILDHHEPVRRPSDGVGQAVARAEREDQRNEHAVVGDSTHSLGHTSCHARTGCAPNPAARGVPPLTACPTDPVQSSQLHRPLVGHVRNCCAKGWSSPQKTRSSPHDHTEPEVAATRTAGTAPGHGDTFPPPC